MNTATVLGIDFGTDSVRALLVDAFTGQELALGEGIYPRWRKGLYTNPTLSCFRQHPLDYLESMELAIHQALRSLSEIQRRSIYGLSVACTGSTPGPVDKIGTPLALLPEFAEDPQAMFVLWKDHTAQSEAEEINRAARAFDTDFTVYSGKVYSPEWFWSKILHISRHYPVVAEKAYTWVEHCDWIPALLTGNREPLTWRRSRTAAGHKAMWHEQFNGLPSEQFLMRLSPYLAQLRPRLYQQTFTADEAAGTIDPAWAKRLGLPEGVVVGIGTLDAHSGAIGAGIDQSSFVKVVGTSTCDLAVIDTEQLGGNIIEGICGQVNGSILRDMVGLEAGQSAFGDVYSWYVHAIASTMQALNASSLPFDELKKKLLEHLGKKASQLPLAESDPIALDWLNGRRTPDPDLTRTGAIAGISLGTSAETIFRSLVEATAFGSAAILHHLESAGIQFKQVKAVGGISKKSPFVMQMLANVLERDITVPATNQACALGAAMLASVACGIHPTLPHAITAMQSETELIYLPDRSLTELYRRRYQRYLKMGTKLLEI